MSPYNFAFLILSLDTIILTEAVKVNCHREDKFVKVIPDGLPLISAIKVITSTKAGFCAAACFDYDGCESVVFDETKSVDNCHFSSEVNGSSSNDASALTYVKEQKVDSVCDETPCQHGGTCTDMCDNPYYYCTCLDYTSGNHCEVNEICSASTPCQNGGECLPSSSPPYYQCQCSNQYTGTNCEIYNGACGVVVCQNGGTCSSQSMEPHYVCHCAAGFVGFKCQSEAAPMSYTGCNSENYNMLTDGSRRIDAPDGNECDKSGNFVPGWYRVSGAAGTMIPTTYPSLSGNVCGTDATGYLAGPNPSEADGIVTRKVCFSYSNKECWSNTEARVLNCGSYYMYDLPNTSGCSLRYCTV